MALVLGAEVGDAFLVGRRKIYVASIDGPTRVTLMLDDGQKITVGSDGLTEVLPDVFVGIGPDLATWRLRLLFEAPQTVPIRRHDRAQN